MNHFAVQQELIQHCKINYTSRKNIEKNDSRVLYMLYV